MLVAVCVVAVEAAVELVLLVAWVNAEVVDLPSLGDNGSSSVKLPADDLLDNPREGGLSGEGRGEELRGDVACVGVMRASC